MKIILICISLISLLLAQSIIWERVAAPDHTISDMIFSGTGKIIAGTYTGGIFITTNRGDTWHISNQGLNNYNIYAVVQNPSSQIFIGTGGNGVYQSTNEGQNWEYLGLDNIYINTLTVLNDSEIFAGTFGDGVFYSSDKGNTWFNRSNGIYFPVIMIMTSNDSGHVFLCTDSGRMYRTTNKGLDWIEINNGLPYTTADALIVDNNGILYAGNTEGFFISGNNGDLWIKRTYGLVKTGVLAIRINSVDNIFISVYDDGIYRSVNQGHTWIKDNNGLENYDIYRLIMSEDDFIYASGWANDFFRSKYSTVVTVEDNNSTPDNFSLYQNYPNPFNPSTTIRYGIPEQSFVTIKVYDILGHEITTLVNEEKPAGSYEVEFNIYSNEGQNLVSGVYFYKLQAGNFIQTKKMVLLK